MIRALPPFRPLASSTSRRARDRPFGPTGSERTLDRSRERGEGLWPAPRRARGRRRQLHRCRRRDHRTPRAQRRGQDDAPAHARHADDPRQRQRARRRQGRRARALRGAAADRRPFRRARHLSAAHRAREHPLFRRVAGTSGAAPKRAPTVDPSTLHRRHRGPPCARLLAGRADEGRDCPRSSTIRRRSCSTSPPTASTS